MKEMLNTKDGKLRKVDEIGGKFEKTGVKRRCSKNNNASFAVI